MTPWRLVRSRQRLKCLGQFAGACSVNVQEDSSSLCCRLPDSVLPIAVWAAFKAITAHCCQQRQLCADLRGHARASRDQHVCSTLKQRRCSSVKLSMPVSASILHLEAAGQLNCTPQQAQLPTAANSCCPALLLAKAAACRPGPAARSCRAAMSCWPTLLQADAAACRPGLRQGPAGQPRPPTPGPRLPAASQAPVP